jgi:hypothetical protein
MKCEFVYWSDDDFRSRGESLFPACGYHLQSNRHIAFLVWWWWWRESKHNLFSLVYAICFVYVSLTCQLHSLLNPNASEESFWL